MATNDGPALVYVGFMPITKKKAAKSLDEVFRQMKLLEYCRSTNAWHAMTDADYVTYALLANQTRRIYEKHPAWSAFSFLRLTENVALPVRILNEIIDPRRFYSHETTSVSENLYEHFGLGANAAMRYQRVIEEPQAASKIYRLHYGRIRTLLGALTVYEYPAATGALRGVN
jgi:hypothetical protein